MRYSRKGSHPNSNSGYARERDGVEVLLAPRVGAGVRSEAVVVAEGGVEGGQRAADLLRKLRTRHALHQACEDVHRHINTGTRHHV